jgi:hypothetical protein
VGNDSMKAPGRHRRRSAAATLTEETARKGLRHRSLCLCPTRAATRLAHSCSVMWRESESGDSCGERVRVETIEPDWIRRPTGEKGEKGEKNKEKKKKRKKEMKKKRKKKN